MFVFTLTAMLAAVLAGCASAPVKEEKQSAPGNVYRNAEHGFSITFPKTWGFKENMYDTIVIGVSPRENDADNMTENVNVLTEKLSGEIMTVDAYMKAADAGIATKVTDYARLDSGSLLIDGNQAGWMVYRHVYEGAEYKALIYVILHGAKAFVVTCTATPDSYAGYEGTFRTIAESIRFDK